MSLMLFKVKGREIKPTYDATLSKDEIFIIIDRHKKRPKIWIWSGSDANLMDRYFAGVSATKIKSKEKLYGASIEVVESGSEPKNFPKLSKEKIIEPLITKEILLIDEEEVKEIEQFEALSEVGEAFEKSKKPEVTIDKEKIKRFLGNLLLDIENLAKKIENFLNEI